MPVAVGHWHNPSTGRGMDQPDRSTAQRLAHGVRQAASAHLKQHQKRATDRLGGVAQAFRQGTAQLGDEHRGVASFLAEAADRIEQMSRRLQEADPAELWRDVQRAATAQPAWLVGGAFVVGFAGARLLREAGSSAAPETPSMTTEWRDDLQRFRDTSGDEAVRSADRATGRVDRMRRVLHDHPFFVGAAAAVCGVAVAASVPVTDVERQWVGDARTGLRRGVRQFAAGVLESLRDAVGGASEGGRGGWGQRASGPH